MSPVKLIALFAAFTAMWVLLEYLASRFYGARTRRIPE